MTTVQNAAADRWAAAAKLADGVTDDGFNKRRARILRQIVALIAGSWIVGVLIALSFGPRGGSRDTGGAANEADSHQLIAQCVFLALGLLVGIIGFVWAKRTGHYITRWRAVGSPLNRMERKSVRRQINGKEEPDREHLGVVVAIAQQSRRAALGVARIYGAIVLFAIATAVGSNMLAIKLLELVVSLLFVVVAVQLVVLYRRSGLFIERYAGKEL